MISDNFDEVLKILTNRVATPVRQLEVAKNTVSVSSCNYYAARQCGKSIFRLNQVIQSGLIGLSIQGNQNVSKNGSR